MERYGSYKDSGVEWIGEIPEEWQVLYPKRVFVLHKEPAKTGDVQLTASQKYGIIPQKEFSGLEGIKPMSVVSGEDILKHVSSGDFVISMRSFQGGLEYSHVDGRISSAYVAVSPRAGEEICPDYFRHLFKSAHYVQALQRTSNLVRDGQALRFSNFTQVYIPVPSLSEQVQISKYLDAKTSEVDNYIDDTERSIGLLAEYRRSVISEAVTKGLDPDVPMRDSGIEWIGEIPEAWGLVYQKLGALKIGSGKTPRGGSEVYLNDGVPFIRSQNVYDEGLILDGIAHISEEVDSEMSSTRVFPGDLLLNITGGSIGRCCKCPEGLEHANVNQHVCIIRAKPSVFENSFLHYCWISDIGQSWVRIYHSGANREGMNFEQIGLAKMPLPTIDEQREIASYLDAKTAEIDSLVADKRRLVEKLKEYRASLVSEAATGKFKVPGVA